MCMYVKQDKVHIYSHLCIIHTCIASCMTMAHIGIKTCLYVVYTRITPVCLLCVPLRNTCRLMLHLGCSYMYNETPVGFKLHVDC